MAKIKDIETSKRKADALAMDKLLRDFSETARRAVKEINDNQYYLELGYTSIDEYCIEQEGISYKEFMGL